jgi:hypothetical protein
VSFRVLVIPEDPTNNGYILRPLAEKMLAEAGKANARVTVLTNPRLNGYEDAIRAIKTELRRRYGHFDLWLFLPDADRAGNLDALENDLSAQGVRLKCCAARPEVEAWLLAGHRERLGVGWSQVPAHPRLKEEVFEPFLARHGDPRSPGGGREALMRDTLSNYRSLLEMCPELKELNEYLRDLPEIRTQ